MALSGNMLSALLGAFAVLPQAWGAAPVSYPIHLEQVARAVLATHPELAGDPIDLPEAVSARGTSPVLEAGPVERWTQGGGTAHVRLRCQSESVCLPFYASVRLPAPQTPAPVQRVRREETPSAPVLRAGERAFMVIDSGRLHLRIPVTCLSSGGVGSTIRVAGPPRSKVFEASILDKTTVRGEL